MSATSITLATPVSLEVKTPHDRVSHMRSLRESGKTLQEIGDLYGISRERVRQLIGNTKKFNYVRKAKDKAILDPANLDKTDQELADELGYDVGYIQYYRSGVRRKMPEHSSAGRGFCVEDEISKILTVNRIPNTLMPLHHPFDILLANGTRVDVKSAAHPLHPPSQYAPYYNFNLGQKRRGEYADFFILVPLKDGDICDIYIIPRDVVPNVDYFRLPALSDEERQKAKRSKYAVYKNRFDLLV